MNEPILHHYPMSLFSEKVRLILGYKNIAWRSVLIPMVMPKPDVVALTGGYRKTPLLQIGADIYCDTLRIAQLLESLQPTPTLYPASAPLAVPLAQWADSALFSIAAGWALQPAGVAAILGTQSPEVLKAFAADRAAMRANAPRPGLHDAAAQLRRHLEALAAQLARGGPWLFGEVPSIADFSVGHCLWFIRLAGAPGKLLDEFAPIGGWLDRLSAIGHHTHTAMSSGDALAVAAGSTGHAPVSVAAGMGFEAGQAVTIAATDYGCDPVQGTLVGLSLDEVVLRRTDERAGTVHVHFPRVGFRLQADRT